MCSKNNDASSVLIRRLAFYEKMIQNNSVVQIVWPRDSRFLETNSMNHKQINRTANQQGVAISVTIFVDIRLMINSRR